MKRPIVWLTKMFFIVVLLALAAFFLRPVFNPLARSTEGVREWVDQFTPHEPTYDAVLAVVREKGWYDAHWRGHVDYDEAPFVVGLLGSYRPLLINIFETSVVVTWEFDEEDLLTSIVVRKEIDAP